MLYPTSDDADAYKRRSFLAGSLPLSFNLSPRQLRFLTACGTGVLVGTALIVIIPEGVEALYDARNIGTSHVARSLPTSSTLPDMTAAIPHSGLSGLNLEKRWSQKDAQLLHIRIDEGGSGLTGPDDGKPVSHDDAMKEGTALKPDLQSPPNEHTDGQHGSEHNHDFEPHAWIGLSVIVGFILMYLIDHLPKLAASAAQSQPSYISLDRLGFRRGASDSMGQDDQHEHSGPGFRPSSTTTGLVIHAAADGIALGASTTGSSQSLGFVVFLALMIHKAPAAFGLTAVLLKQGLSRRKARTHLAVFSLAAPAGALATWAVAQLLGGNAEGISSKFSTGILLLFSGGTFL